MYCNYSFVQKSNRERVTTLCLYIHTYSYSLLQIIIIFVVIDTYSLLTKYLAHWVTVKFGKTKLQLQLIRFLPLGDSYRMIRASVRKYLISLRIRFYFEWQVYSISSKARIKSKWINRQTDSFENYSQGHLDWSRARSFRKVYLIIIFLTKLSTSLPAVYTYVM